MTKDRITGIIGAVLGIMVSVYAHFLPPSGTEGDIGPAIFPYIAAGMLIVCGIILIIRKEKTKATPFFTESIQVKRFLIIVAVYIAYGIMLWAFGFLISTPIACFVLCRMMSGSRKGCLWKQILFSIVVTAVVYYCFYTLLSLKLPAGKIIKFVI